ncbi:MAG: glycosyltransferase family 39 protein [Candidatus Rokubacteria bacterium]|nr:glycosyltransferase family 39 protein [Candidatus Rokubacteria bacterium]
MNRFLVLAALIPAAVLHVATAAVPDIYDELPGQYAATAWQMVESGNWLIPAHDGLPRLQKPPLVYWITAASLRLFGRSEFGARLPTALALVGLMLVTRALGARLYGQPRGAVAGGILGTSLGSVLLGKLIMPEPFLALGIAFALFAVVRSVEDPARRHWWALAAWAAVAFATLSKGLHGLLLPAVIVALLAAGSPASRPSLAALARSPGLVLFLALILPWPLYIESQFPGYLRDNLFNEQLGRLLDTHFPRDSEPTPLPLFWAQHLAWWFPWVLFAPAAAMARPVGSRHPLGALAGVWLLTAAVAASLPAQRQDYHSMFAWPAFALLASRAWDGARDRRALRLALALPLLGLAALGALGLAAYGLFGSVPHPAIGSSASFEERNSGAGAISGIAAAEWWGLRPLLAPAAGGLFVGAAGALALVWRPKTLGWSWAPLAAGSLGLLAAAIVGLQAFAPLFGLKGIGVALDREARGAALIVYDGPSHRASSLCFYAAVRVRWLDRPETEFAVRSRGIGRDRFVTDSEVVKRWRAEESVWLITEERRLQLWGARLGGDPPPVIARSGTRVLLANRAARAGVPSREAFR